MTQSAPVVVLEDFCVEKGSSRKEEKEEKEAVQRLLNQVPINNIIISGSFCNSSCLRKAREEADCHTHNMRPIHNLRPIARQRNLSPITRQHPWLPSP